MTPQEAAQKQIEMPQGPYFDNNVIIKYKMLDLIDQLVRETILSSRGARTIKEMKGVLNEL